MTTSLSYKLCIKVIANSSRNKIGESFIDENGNKIFRIYVGAIREKNKANKALILLVSRELCVDKNKISIISGQTSNYKILLLSGLSIEAYKKVENELILL